MPSACVPLRGEPEVRERMTAMFFNRTGILPLERGEFGADIFYLVLAGNYTVQWAPRIRSRAAC